MKLHETLQTKLTELDQLLANFYREGGFDPLLPEKIDFAANMLFAIAQENEFLDMCGMAEQIRRKARSAALESADKSLLAEIRRQAWREEITLMPKVTIAEKRRLKNQEITKLVDTFFADNEFESCLKQHRAQAEQNKDKFPAKKYANLLKYTDPELLRTKVMNNTISSLGWDFDIDRRDTLPTEEDVLEQVHYEEQRIIDRANKHITRELAKVGVQVAFN